MQEEEHTPRYHDNYIKNGSPRIPLALQTVFLDGNRGIEVNTPPPDKSAMTTFKRWKWFTGGRKSRAAEKIKIEEFDSKTVDTSSVVNTPIRRKKTKSTPLPTLSPQEYLDGMLHTRGYSQATCSTLSSTYYYNKPTPYQFASYGVYIIDLIRTSDVDGLKEVLDLGLSPNACNSHGESILHIACRQGDVAVVNVLLQAGCTVPVSDDNGRTPLHEVCWVSKKPNFTIIEMLLDHDIQLLCMTDSRGQLPLSYTRPNTWSEWLRFLQSKGDTYWPKKSSDIATTPTPIPITTESNLKPIPDPVNALPMQIASMLAAGKVKPSEVRRMIRCTAVCSPTDDDDGSDGDDDDDISDSSYDDETSMDGTTASEMDEVVDPLNDSWDLKEMNDVLKCLDSKLSRPLAMVA